MNKFFPRKQKRLYLSCFLIMYSLAMATMAYSQCTPPAANRSSTCKGTHLLSNTSFNGAYYLDGSESLTTSTFKGTTYKQYTMSLGSGDTLRICNGANIELSNATLGVVIVEAGSQVMFTNSSSLSSTTISNYGTIQLNITTSLFSMNNSATLVNHGVIDANGNDIRNSGKLINFGLIMNVDVYSLNNSAATTCLAATSVMLTNSVDNASANNAFTTNGGGSGCVYIASKVTGNCLTGNGTRNSNTNIQFCYPAGIDTSTSSNCAASGTGFGTGLQGNCTAGSSSCSFPLPVTLLDFKAFKKQEGVLLIWNISNQWDSDHFEILHSGNGKEWKTIGEVSSITNSEGIIRYSFTDYAPNPGLHYYKLAEVGTDGTRREYSIAYISLDSFAEVDFFAYPNPTQGELNVTVNGPYPQYQVEIIDLTGRILFKDLLLPGTNHLQDLSIQPAIYFLRLKIESEYKVKKIVVQ